MKSLLLLLVGRLVALFYKVRRLGGSIPAAGPVILVGNHPNGLVDPVLMLGLTGRDVHFLGKAPLFDVPVLGWMVKTSGGLPVYRKQDGGDTSGNVDMFAAVTRALRAGEVVALFPEGISHSEPALQKLKTGAARMALGAVGEPGAAAGLAVVPVGLVYQDKGRFRSYAATWVGEPIGVEDLAALHASDERAAVERLTERIADGLRLVTVNLDRWEDLPLLEVAERIWRPARGPERVERLARLAIGLHRLREQRPVEARELERRVADFGGRLRRLGLEPDDLRVSYSAPLVLRFVLRNLVVLLVGLPLALVGGLAWLVPYVVVDRATAWRRHSADVEATVKLLAGLLFYPLWWVLAAGLAAWLGGALAGLATALALPPLGLLAAAYLERRAAALEEVAVFLRLGFAPSLKRRLVERRDELAGRIEQLSHDPGLVPGP